MTDRPAQDVRHLPDYAFGSKEPIWWGTLGFIVIEGSGFAMLLTVYFYLASINPEWPLHAALPDPTVGTVLAGYFLVSEIPNIWIKRIVHRFDLRRARLGLLAMSAIGIGAIVIRGYEFGELNIRWDINAYGSIIWAILILHTLHIVTDVAETCVICGMMFFGPVDARRFTDVSENAEYWDFVVLAWLPLYLVIYWAPIWMAE